jgi:CspA family cold shock protein
VIYLESSRVAFEKLRSMFKDGTLRVVEGLKVLEVREDFVGRTQPSLEQGHIKWFNDAKGFGFISRSNAEDVYVHFSAIQSRGYRSLKEGQPVQFKIVKGPKGWQAENVELLNPPGKTD